MTQTGAGSGGGPLAAAVRLGVQADALAALAAWLRVRSEGLPCDPQVSALLEEISREVLGGGGAADGAPASGAPPVDPTAAATVVGLARAFLRQAVELVDNPGRAGAWDQVDVPLLQSIGRLSMGIAGAVRASERSVPGLQERLAAPGARILDVGTGTGWLAVALAHAYPQAEVVGVDVFAPALDLARANVAEQGLGGRVDLRLVDAADLEDAAGFDVVWLPLPFLSQAVVPGVLTAAVRVLRPGGLVMPGTFTGSGGRLSELVTDLRTVRGGGHPWTPDEILDLLRGHGLDDVQEIPRTWPAPVRLYAGRG